MDLLFDQFYEEFDRGIYDRDCCIMKNTGFIGDRPVHYDVGKLVKSDEIKDPKVRKEYLDRVYRKVSAWFKQNYPEYEKQFLNG